MTREEKSYRLKLGRLSIALGRSVVYTTLGFLLFVGLVLVATRVGIPYLVQNKSQIEKLVSERAGLTITVEKMNVDWDYLFPGIEMQGLKVVTAQGGLVTEADRLSASITPLSLLTGKVGLATLTVHGAQLDVRRDRKGRWWIGSMEFRVKPEMAELTSETGSAADIGSIVARLGEINFSDLQLVWKDDFLDRPAFVVSKATLNISSDGKHHVLGFTGSFPESFCSFCKIQIDTQGRIDQPQSWTGRIYTELAGFQPDKAPAVIRSRLPYNLAGKFSIALRAELHAGAPRVVQGYVSGEKLFVGDKTSGRKFAMDMIDTSVLWRTAGEGWVFEASDMNLGIKKHSWRVGDVWFARRKDKLVANIDALDIADMASLADMVLEPSSLNAHKLSSFHPKGVLRNIRLNVPVTISAEKPEFSVSARFYELGWKGTGKFPSASGFDGTVHYDGARTDIEFSTSSASLDIAYMFRDKVEIDQLGGSARISKTAKSWELLFEDIDVSNQDLHLRGEALFQIPLPDEKGNRESPYLDTQWTIVRGRGNRASRYFPVNLLKPNLLEWMDKSIKDGVVTGGQAFFKGRFSQFPFTNNDGRFEVMATIEKGVLKFLPGWPALENIGATLHFKGPAMNILSNNATINGMGMKQVSVTASDFSDPVGRRLQINGKVSGSGQSLAKVIENVRHARYASDWARAIPGGIDLYGRNHLRLSLDYDPLEPSQTRVLGEYRPDNMAVNVSALGLAGNSVYGNVFFDNKGVSAGNVYGDVLGGSARFDITSSQASTNGREVTVKATGRLTASGIAENYGSWLNKYLSGYGQWYGDAVFRNGQPWLNVEASLDQLASTFPYPLAKEAGKPSRLAVTTVAASGTEYGIRASIPNLAKLELYTSRHKDTWKHARSVLMLGEYNDVISQGPGFHVMVNAGTLDLDAWRDHLFQSGIPSGSAVAGIRSIRINAGKADLFDRHFGGVAAHINYKAGRWNTKLTGDNVDGVISYTASGRKGRLEAELNRLAIPDITFRQPAAEMDVRNLPAIAAHIREFEYGAMKLGTLQLKGGNVPVGWRLEHARFDSDALHITAWGELKRMGGRNHGELELTGSSNNLGKGLEQLSLPGQVSSGVAYASASLAWNGVDEFSIASANGKFKIKAENGSFLKLDQGAGRMLGIFDFDAFSRYARLDFSTVFGAGYAFDQVKGSFDLERGDIYTRDLKIKGPSADMLLSGRVGLVDEDYDFVVGVNPSVSDTLAFASWGLGVPQVGAAILLFNRLFKKDIEAAGRLTYLVQGTWEKPVVKRVEKTK